MSRKQSKLRQGKRAAHIDAPVSLGASYEIDITGIGDGGEGVGRYEGFTVFVPFALPEERVRARIVTLKKNYAVGVLEFVVVPSPHRIEPPCDAFGTCGGCRLQHVDYAAQLELKTQKVRNVIERIAKLDPAIVKSAAGPSDPWYYRNKMQLPIGGTSASPLLGFYAMNSHDIIAHETCLIQDDMNNRLARACEELIRMTGVAPYDESTGEGLLRHAVGRINRDGTEAMLILVTTRPLADGDIWVRHLREACPILSSVVNNINPKRTNVILGSENKVLYGNGYIRDAIGELEFRISPHSFFQVNPTQTLQLYEQALLYADLKSDDTVIDAYCGTGTISLFMAKRAKRVIGIEIVEPAVRDAEQNATRNGVTNATFIADDATRAMPKLYADGVRPDVVVFDPARAGCTPEVLDAAVMMHPKRMVYVSCNPASMARDLAILAAKGYVATEVQPVDMFPQTPHVECVARVERR